MNKPRLIPVPISVRKSHWRRQTTGEIAPCAICGVPIEEPQFEVHLVDGGTHLCHPEDEYTDEAADLGWYPVGRSCIGRFPQIKPFIIRCEEVK